MTATPRLTATIIATALFMEQLDGTVLATALPTMAQSFGVDALHMSVALTAYLLSLAVFIPASGWVADRFGACRVFCAAMGLFTLGSILCGQAWSLPVLVVARIVQGLGGAMMTPVGRLVLLRSVPRKDLVSAMTWMLVPALVGPIIGPPVGGLFVTYLSWRWIFYINIPVGLLGIGLAARYIPNFREASVRRFDWVGLLLSGACLAGLTFGFELASRGALTVWQAAAVLGASLASGVLYWAHARRIAAPVLDLSLMRIPTFGLSVWAGSLTRITAGATPFLLPMMLQLGFGLSAASSGAITFVSAAGSMVMKAAAPPALRRFGYRATLVWNGLLATGVVMLCAAFRPSWPMAAIYAVLLAGGFFQSLQFTAYNTVAYADIPRERMSAATSFYTTFQMLMLSAGICVASASLATAVAFRHEQSPHLPDFSVAFLVVGVITLFAAPVIARLPREAGDDMAGRGTLTPRTVAPSRTGTAR